MSDDRVGREYHAETVYWVIWADKPGLGPIGEVIFAKCEYAENYAEQFERGVLIECGDLYTHITDGGSER